MTTLSPPARRVAAERGVICGTLRAVAAPAQVSIKTASRVFAGDGPVAPDTRDAVLRAAREVGYVPNRAARAMRSGDSGIVGLLAPFVIVSPLATEIIRGVET